MIPVIPQPEPQDFDAKVRVKGKKFLQKAPAPIIWQNREYWRNSIEDLYKAYYGICSYSAQWIPKGEGTPTVDHFIPKSRRPALAYEWENFRLSSLKMNSRKRDFQDVLDPFKIEDKWFILNFPSLMIKPEKNLEEPIKDKVQKTINRLQLNREDTIQSRLHWLMPYCHEKVTYAYLKEIVPFIAYELERQHLINDIKQIMLQRFS